MVFYGDDSVEKRVLLDMTKKSRKSIKKVKAIYNHQFFDSYLRFPNLKEMSLQFKTNENAILNKRMLALRYMIFKKMIYLSKDLTKINLNCLNRKMVEYVNHFVTVNQMALKLDYKNFLNIQTYLNTLLKKSEKRNNPIELDLDFTVKMFLNNKYN